MCAGCINNIERLESMFEFADDFWVKGRNLYLPRKCLKALLILNTKTNNQILRENIAVFNSTTPFITLQLLADLLKIPHKFSPFHVKSVCFPRDQLIFFLKKMGCPILYYLPLSSSLKRIEFQILIYLASAVAFIYFM